MFLVQCPLVALTEDWTISTDSTGTICVLAVGADLIEDPFLLDSEARG
jgi:hypothetical protein